jgi:uracil-DNA glycosylase
MNTASYLTGIAKQNGLPPAALQLPDCELLPEKIKVIMISEVPPQNPADGFYSTAPDPDYMKTTLGLFNQAGVDVKSIQDILNLGIYITTAVKSPKTGYAVEPEIIKAHLPVLEAELALFPNLKIIMLMGDVAKKAVNMIAKARTKKNIIPSESTYKIRGNEYYWDGIQVFPSYIMTGKNLLIEPFKRDTIADDIRRMMVLI